MIAKCLNCGARENQIVVLGYGRMHEMINNLILRKHAECKTQSDIDDFERKLYVRDTSLTPDAPVLETVSKSLLSGM